MTDQRLTDTALIVGATMRLTRLIVTDDLGEWWIRDPLDRWMHGHPNGYDSLMKLRQELIDAGTPEEDLSVPVRLPSDPDRMRWHKYLGGLSCPWCVGFWLGAGVLASHSVAKHVGVLGLWRYVAGALTLNEVAAHAGIRAGDFE